MNDVKIAPFELVDLARYGVHGGQLLVDALCRRMEVWQKAIRYPALTKHGTQGTQARRPTPSSALMQLFFTFTCGRPTSSSYGSFGRDTFLPELLGLEELLDEEELRGWLGAQTDETVTALREVNAGLVRDLLREAEPTRILQGKQLEIFFGTRLQTGPRWQYEPWAGIYEPRGLYLQTLWAGPLVLDAILEEGGGPGWSCAHHKLPEFLRLHQGLWKERIETRESTWFYAGTSCSRQDHLEALAAAGLTGWSVTRHKDIYDELASELAKKPVSSWVPADATDREFDQYGMLYTDPPRAVGRRRAAADSIWHCTYLILSPGVEDKPKEHFERHSRLDTKEQTFSDMLVDFAIDRPPGSDLGTNRVLYSLATLAFNVLTGIKLLALPDEAQTWTMRRIQLEVLTQPIRKGSHGGYHTERIFVPAKWRPVYATLLQNWTPRRKRRSDSGKARRSVPPGGRV